MHGETVKFTRWRVLSVRYALSPYIKQTRFVFKGLMIGCSGRYDNEFSLSLF